MSERVVMFCPHSLPVGWEDPAVVCRECARGKDSRIASLEAEVARLKGRADHEFQVDWNDDVTGGSNRWGVRDVPADIVDDARIAAAVAIRVREFFRRVATWELRREIARLLAAMPSEDEKFALDMCVKRMPVKQPETSAWKYTAIDWLDRVAAALKEGT
jgi:uncharacterized small protein (DUF1192 family)